MPWSWEEALKTAILIGISISEFDEITPYELMLFAEAYMEKQEAESIERLTLVWLGEYYHRIKRLPALKDEIKKIITGDKYMSDNDMLSMVKQLNAQFGGNVESG